MTETLIPESFYMWSHDDVAHWTTAISACPSHDEQHPWRQWDSVTYPYAGHEKAEWCPRCGALSLVTGPIRLYAQDPVARAMTGALLAQRLAEDPGRRAVLEYTAASSIWAGAFVEERLAEALAEYWDVAGTFLKRADIVPLLREEIPSALAAAGGEATPRDLIRLLRTGMPPATIPPQRGQVEVARRDAEDAWLVTPTPRNRGEGIRAAQRAFRRKPRTHQSAGE